VLLFSFKSGIIDSLSDKMRFFLILLIQLEVFIFIASRIFKEISVGLSQKEFTRIILKRLVIFIIICFIAALIIFLSFRYLVALSEHKDLAAVWRNIMEYEIGNWVISTLKGLSLGAVIFVIIQWQDALKREQKLREENLIFQNETLKNQINPHFLFNSLNTLSSLIGSQPETADRFIGRLSSIYRYILENSQKDKVPLENELSFISDYFFLHQIRDEDKIVLEISVPDREIYMIMPVSLQILLENALNHNIASRENPLKISIYRENEMIVVKNNLQKKSIPLKSTQVGLRNLSERVRIISGRSIIIEETSIEFIVKIPLLQ
jgi:LytS/YehU family sensor histidine kinase